MSLQQIVQAMGFSTKVFVILTEISYLNGFSGWYSIKTIFF